ILAANSPLSCGPTASPTMGARPCATLSPCCAACSSTPTPLLPRTAICSVLLTRPPSSPVLYSIAYECKQCQSYSDTATCMHIKEPCMSRYRRIGDAITILLIVLLLAACGGATNTTAPQVKKPTPTPSPTPGQGAQLLAIMAQKIN